MSRSLGCACGVGLGASGFPAAAGELAGLATFARDLKAVADQFAATAPGVTFNKPLYDVTIAKMRAGVIAQTPPTPAEFRNLFLGTIGQMSDALIRAKMLAALPVNSAAERSANQAAQAALLGPAQLMRDSLVTFMNAAVRVPSSGTSGLGVFGIDDLIIIAVIAGVIIIIALTTVAIVAATYLADSSDRLTAAAASARTICAQAHPPCTPEQYAEIQRQLGLGPLDNILPKIVDKVTTTVLIVTGVVTGLVALGWLYKHNEGAIKRKLGMNRRRRAA